jgi:hypothetical protein
VKVMSASTWSGMVCLLEKGGGARRPPQPALRGVRCR